MGSPFRNLLKHIEKISNGCALTISIEGQKEQWLFEAQELKNELQEAAEMAALKEAINRQVRPVATVPLENILENSDQYQLLLNVLQNIEKELEDANIAIERLQEQIAGDRTRPAKNEMDTVLERMLHELERCAALYHSSPVDEVVIELRKLIAKVAGEQVEGVTLESKPPKWEYDYTLFNPGMNYIAHFNKMGGEGWELVHCDFGNGTTLFKRPKCEKS